MSTDTSKPADLRRSRPIIALYEASAFDLSFDDWTLAMLHIARLAEQAAGTKRLPDVRDPERKRGNRDSERKERA